MGHEVKVACVGATGDNDFDGNFRTDGGALTQAVRKSQQKKYEGEAVLLSSVKEQKSFVLTFALLAAEKLILSRCVKDTRDSHLWNAGESRQTRAPWLPREEAAQKQYHCFSKRNWLINRY